VVYCFPKIKILFIFCSFKGGPTIEQRFESYYNYCGLFNHILSEWLLLTSRCVVVDVICTCNVNNVKSYCHCTFSIVSSKWGACRNWCLFSRIINRFVERHKVVTSELLNNTHRHTHLTALCPGLPGWAGTRKIKPIWILLKQETVSGSGISCARCKCAPHSRQITTPAPYHSDFYRPDALPAAQPTASKHWRDIRAAE